MQDGKHVILYIDDDRDFLDVMRMMLEKYDYVLAEAMSAEEGLRVYKETQPDIVLVDLMMEEVDAGTTFVKEIRALGDPPPIIMISSVGDDFSQVADYNALGLDGVLQKPIDEDRLVKLLQSKLA